MFLWLFGFNEPTKPTPAFQFTKESIQTSSTLPSTIEYCHIFLNNYEEDDPISTTPQEIICPSAHWRWYFDFKSKGIQLFSQSLMDRHSQVQPALPRIACDPDSEAAFDSIFRCRKFWWYPCLAKTWIRQSNPLYNLLNGVDFQYFPSLSEKLSRLDPALWFMLYCDFHQWDWHVVLH